MPVFTVTGPDGEKHKVTAPEGATQRDAIAFIAKTKYGKTPAKAAPEAPAPERKRTVSDEVTGFGNTLLNAQTLGLGNEIVGGARALMDYLIDTEAEKLGRELTGEERKATLGELYDMYSQDATQSKEDFREANPKTALATEVAGAIAAPTSLIPGSKLASGPLRALSNTARAGTEGAIYGFNEAEGGLDERLQGAKEGATTAALFSGGLQALGGTGRQIAKRRVAQDLVQRGKDGVKNFKPLHMADTEGAIGKFYRNVLGGAYGSGGMLGKQESRYINQAPKLARFADDAGQVVEETVGTKRAVGELKDAVTDAARVERDTLASGVKAQTAANKAAKASTKEAGEIAVKDAQRRGAWQLIDDAIPDNMAPETADAIRNAPNTVEAANLLDAWYSSPAAFSQVKGRSFQWDPKLQARIRAMVNNNADVAGEAAGQMGGKARLDAALAAPKGSTGTGTLSGTIDGETLMALRNSAAIGSNRTTAGLGGSRKRTIANEIDDMIREQLGGEDSPAWQAYREQLDRYATKSAVSKAANAARKRLDDDFTPADAGRKFGDRGAARDGSDLARNLQREVDAAKRAAGEQLDDTVRQGEKLKSRLANRKKRVGQRERAAKNRLDRETTGLLPEDQTAWSRLASTAILSMPFGGPTPAGLAAATGLSSTLATPGVQRFVAGQSAPQRAMQALGDNETAKYMATLLRQAGERTAALRALEDEENR